MTSLRLGDLNDFLVVDGEAVLLVGDRCMRLNHIATEALSFMEQPRSREEVYAHLEATFGAPPDRSIAEAVDGLITELASQGVIVEDPS